MKRIDKTKVFTVTNILILILALISINFIASKIYCKLDLTSGHLFTLSKGSKTIVKAIDDEVVLKYFYSSSNENVPIFIKNYGKMVEELLKEFVSYNDKLTLEVYDPKQDTDEEDMASKYGIYGEQVGSEPFYMGLAILYRNDILKIPFFDPRKESTLEYDIASLMSKLKSSGSKKVLGILSSFSLDAPQPDNPMMQQQQKNNQMSQWLFTKELEKIYEIKKLEFNVEEIPSDVNLLLVLHPKDISEPTEYAIEQYILNGGKAVLVVDPSANSLAPQQSQMYGMMPRGTSSNLKRVFKALELEYDDKKIVVDETHGARVSTQMGGEIYYPVWLMLNEEAFNKDLVITNQLAQGLFVETGFFNKNFDSKTTYTSLINTGSTSGTIASEKLMMFNPAQMDYEKLQKSLSVAGFAKGIFKSAFSGKPANSKYSKPHLTEASKENLAVVIGDVDFLNNKYSLNMFQILGQVMVQPLNHNIAFLANALEFISGSEELITIRSKGKFSRPFTKIEEMQKSAQSQWYKEEQALTMKIQEMQDNLNKMQASKTKGNELTLSPEQQKEIQRFRQDKVKYEKQRREIRKNLRQDVESLGTWITIINLTFIPLIVLLLGLYVYLKRNLGIDLLKRSKA